MSPKVDRHREHCSSANAESLSAVSVRDSAVAESRTESALMAVSCDVGTAPGTAAVALVPPSADEVKPNGSRVFNVAAIVEPARANKRV